MLRFRTHKRDILGQEAGSQTCETVERHVEICRLYADEAADEHIEEIRRAQDEWKISDLDGVRTFFRAVYEAHPGSPRHEYLYGRVAPTRLESLAHARRVIAEAPSWPYGYRLLMGSYCACIFRCECEQSVRETLIAEMPKDAHYFERVFEETPDAGSLLNFVFDYHIYNKNYNEACAVLKKARELEQGWAMGDDADMVVFAGRGSEKPLRRYVTSIVKRNIAAGTVPKAGKEKAVVDWLVRYYRAAFAYDKAMDTLNSWLKRAPLEEKAGVHLDLARLASLLRDNRRAFDNLEQAAKLGFDQYERIEQERDLIWLQDDPRWDYFLIAFQNNWLDGKQKRRHAAIAGRVDLPAPDVAMPDVQGNPVRLQDLRGNVVILDFWSTFCGPCRKVMPMLDKFAREDAGPDVRVFSVNVWETNRSYAKAFMERNGYCMNLLFGDPDTVREFGVISIPTLIVIGPDGRVHYREHGFKKDLEERLVWWTHDLLSTSAEQVQM